MGIGIQIDFDIGSKFKNQMQQAALSLKDLGPAFQQIADDYYQGQQDVFKQSPGPYPALSEQYSRAKKAKAGFIYPILVRSGALREAASVQGGSGNITKFDRQSITFAVSERDFPYAAVHQYGGKNTPMRSYLFVGPESPFANSNHRNRPKRWISILRTYVKAELLRIGLGGK